MKYTSNYLNFRYFLKVQSNFSLKKQNFVSLSNCGKVRFSDPKFYLSIHRLLSYNKSMDLQSVIKVFESEVPNYLAEKWDNTGLLIEPSKMIDVSSILFTNDLTEKVLHEALILKVNLIISYHPPIFSSIKSLKMSNWKDHIVVKCIENSIALYSPHTSCDAVFGGVNDWLINCFSVSEVHPIHPSYETTAKYSNMIECSLSCTSCPDLSGIPDTEVCYTSSDNGRKYIRIKVSKTSLNPVVKLLSDADDTASISITALDRLPIPSCGMGRIGKFIQPLTLNECIKKIKHYLKLEYIRFSPGISHSLESTVSTVAVCAGSGASVLKGVSADLYITGEMSHHDLLDANHRDVSVVLCEHSNSERGYLPHLAEKLRPKLPGIQLVISSTDRDPVHIV